MMNFGLIGWIGFGATSVILLGFIFYHIKKRLDHARELLRVVREYTGSGSVVKEVEPLIPSEELIEGKPDRPKIYTYLYDEDSYSSYSASTAHITPKVTPMRPCASEAHKSTKYAAKSIPTLFLRIRDLTPLVSSRSQYAQPRHVETYRLDLPDGKPRRVSYRDMMATMRATPREHIQLV